MLRVNGDAITVNRNKFHDRLKAEFQTHLAELRDLKNSPLREQFSEENEFHQQAVLLGRRR